MDVIRLFPLLLMTLLASSYAKAELIKGSMSCKIKSSNVLSIDDGIFLENSAFEGRAIVGDQLSIDYTLEDSTFRLSTVEDNRGDSEWSFVPFYLAAHDDDASPIYTSNKKLEILHRDPHAFIEIDENRINAVTASRWHIKTSRLSLYRYFKNDWSGVGYIMEHPDQLYSYTIACRHDIDSMTLISEKLRSVKADRLKSTN